MQVISHPEKKELRANIQYFLNSSTYGGDEVRRFIDSVNQIGRVAIFGGMLRDMVLFGIKGFSSDVDLVVESENLTALEKVLDSYQFSMNSFGGYRVQLRHWMIDIWPLGSTWAFSKGYVNGSTINDLIKTTFFNWDAIVYDTSSAQIYCESTYFEELSNRILRINFLHNPNPRGIAVRALRLMIIRRARLSRELAEYLKDVIQTFGVQNICDAERSSYQTRKVVSEYFADKVLRELKCPILEEWILPFNSEPSQMSLSLKSPAT